MAEGSFKVPDLLLPEWSADEILLTGYQVVQAQQLGNGGHDIRLGDVRVLLLRGSLEYITAGDLGVREIDDENFEVLVGPIERVTSPPGVYLMVVTPKGGQDIGRAREAAALAAAVLGEAVTYRHLFTNVLSTTKRGTQIAGPVLVHPKSFPPPLLDAESASQYKAAYLALGSAGEPLKARAQLSLQWFAEAQHSSDEQALLRYWFAIETLAMPDTTNIRPANQLLASAYGMTEQEAQREIELGRLYGLRSDIAHGGLRSALDSRLLRFAAAVYTDLLEATLGLPCRRRAIDQKSAIGESIAALVPQV